MTFEMRSGLRLRAAHPLTFLAAALLACGESHLGAAARAGNGAHSGNDGAVGQADAGSDSGAQSGAGAGSGGTAGSSGSGTAGHAGTSPDSHSCSMDSDCGFGEIDHEILSKSDCPCLLGCPFIPQNQATLEHRRAQYAALCEPGRNGQGTPCPIDDCVQMPDAVCVNGTCGGARPP
jgi:hypothetical protein